MVGMRETQDRIGTSGQIEGNTGSERTEGQVISEFRKRKRQS